MQSARGVEALTRDLGVLPAFLAAADDVVVVPELPSPAFVRQLEAAGFRPPRFVTAIPGRDTDPHLGDLRPWGWSPATRDRFAPVFARMVSRPRFFERPWSPQWTALYRKSGALRVLARVTDGADEGWLTRSEDHGARAEDTATVLEHIRGWYARGHRWCVVKADLGSSGRNMIRVSDGTLSPEQHAWLERALVQHGAVVVEPWLDRLCDVSMQLHIDVPGRARLLHVGRFLADARGQYLGTLLGPLTRTLPRDLRRWASGDGRDRDRLPRVAERVAREVAGALEPSGYVGPVGVDALIHRDANGELRFKPVVEINPRTTMGHVGVGMQRALAPGRVGLWTIVPIRELAASGEGSVQAFADALRARHPPRLQSGSLDAGFVPTTDPSSARTFATMLFAGPSLEAVAEMCPTTLPVHRAGFSAPAR